MKMAIITNILYPEIGMDMWKWMKENSTFLPSDEGLEDMFECNESQLDDIKMNYFQYCTDEYEMELRTNPTFIRCIELFKPKHWKIVEIDDDLTIANLYVEVDEISEVVKENHREWR